MLKVRYFPNSATARGNTTGEKGTPRRAMTTGTLRTAGRSPAESTEEARATMAETRRARAGQKAEE